MNKTALIGGSILLLLVVGYILYQDQINEFIKKQTDKLGSDSDNEVPEETPEPPETGEGLQPKVYDPNLDLAVIKAIDLEVRRLKKDAGVISYLRDFQNIGNQSDLIKGTRHPESVADLINRNGFTVLPSEEFVNHLKTISPITYNPNVGSSLNPTRNFFKERFNNELVNVKLFDETIIDQAQNGGWGDFRPDKCGTFERKKECDRERNVAIVATLQSYINDMKILASNAIAESERFSEVLEEQAIQNLVQNGWLIKGY